MYETAMLRPFKLKTTNGDKLAYYGNCHVNITSVPFDNLKNRNNSAVPFDIERNYFYANCEKVIKITSTVHVIGVSYKYLNNEPINYLTLKSDNYIYNYAEQGIISIPNLEESETYDMFDNFINSINNKAIKKTLRRVFYNITQDNSPYYTSGAQDPKIKNNFVLNKNDVQAILNSNDGYYPTSQNNYPQNAILLIPQDWSRGQMQYPCFFYRQNTMCNFIDDYASFNTMPCYGITAGDYETIYFYWTTYKGV